MSALFVINKPHHWRVIYSNLTGFKRAISLSIIDYDFCKATMAMFNKQNGDIVRRAHVASYETTYERGQLPRMAVIFKTISRLNNKITATIRNPCVTESQDQVSAAPMYQRQQIDVVENINNGPLRQY